MRVLALDYGSARCGCAVSDPTRTLVTPLEAISAPDTPAGMDALREMIGRHEPVELVVGLPLLESGEEGSQAAAARSFAGRLKAAAKIPVKFHDERYTTRQALQSISHGAASDENSLAAAHLLEAYLDAEAKASDSAHGA
jgi:putative Holliday junction resolvase